MARKRTARRHDPNRDHRRRLCGDGATLPLGSVGYEAKRTDQGEILIWLERRALDRLDALRQPGEGYSEIILRDGGNGVVVARQAAKPALLQLILFLTATF